MLSLNCRNLQHVKIFLPCNFEVNPITYFGVIALFFINFNTSILYLKNYYNVEIEGKFKLQKCSACQDLQKMSPQLKMCDNCEELFLLKCIFLLTHCFWLLK